MVEKRSQIGFAIQQGFHVRNMEHQGPTARRHLDIGTGDFTISDGHHLRGGRCGGDSVSGGHIGDRDSTFHALNNARGLPTRRIVIGQVRRFDGADQRYSRVSAATGNTP